MGKEGASRVLGSYTQSQLFTTPDPLEKEGFQSQRKAMFLWGTLQVLEHKLCFLKAQLAKSLAMGQGLEHFPMSPWAVVWLWLHEEEEMTLWQMELLMVACILTKAIGRRVSRETDTFSGFWTIKKSRRCEFMWESSLKFQEYIVKIGRGWSSTVTRDYEMCVLMLLLSCWT